MPALIKVIETGRINKYFCMQKIFKIGVILWENAQCVCRVSHFLPKRLYFQLIFWALRSWTKKVYVALFLTQISALICAKGFIKFKQVVFAHTLNNQRVSNSVFSVSSYIQSTTRIMEFLVVDKSSVILVKRPKFR